MIAARIEAGFQLLFPTIILTRTLPEAEVSSAVLRELILSRAAAEPTKNRSNVGGWHSKRDLFDWGDPSITSLRSFIEKAVFDYVAFDRRETRVTFEGMYLEGWAMVLPDGAYHKPHVHQNAALSGVYYVDPGDANLGDAEAGTLELLDPRNRPNHFATSATEQRDRYTVRPEAGMLVVFPGWIYHYVNPIRGSRPRVAVAFNANVHLST